MNAFESNLHKKVLLREGKRLTTRCVAGSEGVDRQTDTCQNFTFPHSSDAGGKNDKVKIGRKVRKTRQFDFIFFQLFFYRNQRRSPTHTCNGTRKRKTAICPACRLKTCFKVGMSPKGNRLVLVKILVSFL